ncbi:polyprenol monophosphomannose synthase [Calditrichota bacterium]
MHIKRALVIIPTYNERENIAEVISSVLEQDDSLSLLVIDDNSPDGTGKIVKDLSNSTSRLHLMERPGKLGLGTAYVAGFKYALEHSFDYIFEMDADFSHDPTELPNFLKAIYDADLVIGSRYIRGVNVVNWPLSRLILSIGASVYTRIITGIPLKDVTSGFKCFRREVLETINLDGLKSGGYAFQVELHWHVWQHGFRIKEIPIIFVDRTVGKSKMSKAIVREAIFVVWKLALSGLFNKPLKRKLN